MESKSENLIRWVAINTSGLRALYAHNCKSILSVKQGVKTGNTYKIIWTLNEKVNYKTAIECVKESNIFIGLKKTCLGVLDRGNRDKDNKIGLK